MVVLSLRNPFVYMSLSGLQSSPIHQFHFDTDRFIFRLLYSINYPDIRCLLSLISCTEEYVNHISFDSFRLFIFSTEEVSDLKNILQRQLKVTVLKVSEHRYRNAVNRHLLISTWEVVSTVFVLIVYLFISPGPVFPFYSFEIQNLFLREVKSQTYFA